MADSVNDLMQKFVLIRAARAKGDIGAARSLFDTIDIDDFPKTREWPVSDAMISDPESALFFIDHDWDDHGGGDWCNHFIDEVICVLRQLVD